MAVRKLQTGKWQADASYKGKRAPRLSFETREEAEAYAALQYDVLRRGGDHEGMALAVKRKPPEGAATAVSKEQEKQRLQSMTMGELAVQTRRHHYNRLRSGQDRGRKATYMAYRIIL